MLSTLNNSYIGNVEASNINKAQEDLSPLITHTTEQIGDREKMIVTVSVKDRSGTGIKEFRDYNNNLINGDSYTFEINRRGNYTFSAIDNNDKTANLKIDDSWVNPYTKNGEGRITRGSGYWSSSNIREWLNSDEIKVDYTCNPPSDEFTNGKGYDTEKGFLANFSEKEKDSIAITERRIHINGYFDGECADGGIKYIQHLNMSSQSFLSTLDNIAFDYKNLKYKVEKDKIFLLNTSEFYWYIYRRNFNIDRELTPEAISNRGLSNKNPGWYLQYSAEWNKYNWMAYVKRYSELILNHGYADELKGIVPALHLKNNYILPNGMNTNSLNIGDKIEFGSYFNSPIEWEVINITKEGYPLIITTKSIDAKVFDAIGDKSRMYSDYINFDIPDVSIVEDLEYRTTYEIDDYDLPEVSISNESELEKRQNNGYSLSFFINDNNGSGIKYIELPDGNKLMTENFSYYFDSNDTYLIKYMDNAGNYNIFSVPVYNINLEPEVDISVSASDTWANQDVAIDIRTSNEIIRRFKNTIISNSAYNGLSYATIPNYLSYSNSRFKVKVSVKLIKSTSPEDRMTFGFNFRDKGFTKYSYKNDVKYLSDFCIYAKDLSYDEYRDFEFEYTIPNSYSYALKTYISSNVASIFQDSLIYDIKELEYELINDGTSDFKISSIVLPSGEEIFNCNYRGIISKEGINSFAYTIRDSRGKETTKTITTKIDKTAPTLNLDYDKSTEITTQNIVVSINASDSLSGFKRIKLPNSNYINNSNSTYTITRDGDYTFECEDIAGNITTKTITINNIDKEKPNVSIDKNDNWTNKPIQININTGD